MPRLYEIILRKNLQLDEKDRALARMEYRVGRELRNPLGGIRELSSILSREKGLTVRQKAWVKLINSSSLESMDMIREMLKGNGRDRKGIVLQRIPLDIEVYLRQCVDVLRERADAKFQRLIFNFEERGQPRLVHIDPDAYFRVYASLVDNAVKFSPHGSDIRITACCRGDRFLLEVADPGIGIPLELQDHIFEPYSEANRPGTCGEATFGRGLVSARQIVEAHGGTIDFESVEAAGTVFRIEIPVTS
ncbi:MAG: HAMP domain-containing sensor histidine kinase [Balneolaceae bacterium]|nr:HAMP domain-containing sensor histidine kinase [Balneolaceae bacterium]